MIYKLHRKIELPISLEKSWSFFSNPANLAAITPPQLGLKITSDPESKTYAGQIITYSVGVLLGIRMPWVTEITHLQKPYYFVDEQRYGPYKMWHHQHRFSETAGGTLIEDIVDYIMPFGPLGPIAHSLHVKHELQRIFDFREQALARMFGVVGK